MCGGALLVESDVRYELRIEVKAAYDPMELTKEDLRRDLEAEIRETLGKMEGMSREEAERSVYKTFTFDLCPPCQRRYVSAPLPKIG
jgi:hypothetical protein